jgi:prepilin-type N-terminal cleavage/methylation domain-containing protein
MKKGFTLLEVLVAIVIISSSIITVFQVFSLGFKNISKIYAYEGMYLALTNILEEIDLVSDFETNRERRGTAGGYEYEWRATPSSLRQRMTGAEDNFGPYEVILYRIDLRVYYETQERTRGVREFTFHKTGWTYARE